MGLAVIFFEICMFHFNAFLAIAWLLGISILKVNTENAPRCA